jgi:hypothetical protein
MRPLLAVLTIAALALSPAAFAQNTIPLAEAAGKPYDQVANCLMKRTTSPQFKVWPLVYVPPRREALVNIWLRGHEYDPPIAFFRVVENGGMTRVTLERKGTAGPSQAAAESAAKQCLL